MNSFSDVTLSLSYPNSSTNLIQNKLVYTKTLNHDFKDQRTHKIHFNQNQTLHIFQQQANVYYYSIYKMHFIPSNISHGQKITECSTYNLS